MARSITDARQVTLRSFLQQIANRTSYLGTSDAKPANQSELDNLLAGIADELTPLLRMTASNPTDRVVSIGSSTLTNSESSMTRSISHIGALLPSFSSGTVTFPASSGGTITVSPGNNGTLTVSSGNYIKVLIYMDATGALNVLPGVENAVEASATVLAAPKKTLPIGYVTLQNVSGTIQNIAQNKIYQFGTGAGGSSSGTGSGVGSDLSSLTFKAEFNDDFDDIPSGSASAVDITSGKTDSALYSAANAYYRLAYDASRTVTGTGTSMTLSGTPSFTVKIGDMLIVAGQARRITAVASQTSYTIESAFTTNPSAASATVSQAVYTKDLNNTVIDGLAISSAFSSSISQIMVDYEDTTAADDVVFDANSTPVIAFSASSDGTTYSSVAVRPTNLTDLQSIVNLSTSGTSLYIRFFANKSSGTGFVNILKHHTYFHRDLSYLDGSQINQSYGLTNGAGTEVNVIAISNATGKTRIQKTWTYPVGVNSGTTNGALKVYLNGQKIPRFIDTTLTPDAYYKEIDSSTIELDQDYSSYSFPFEIIQDVAVIDVTDSNASAIAAIQEGVNMGLQGFVSTNSRLSATSVSGTPATGTFYSSITNRASIVDFTQDLKPRMGIERVQTQQIYQIQNEFGPNGEVVWGLVNDTSNQFRAIGGGWQSFQSSYGNQFQTSLTTDYVEITFYGTGLNLMTLVSASRDVRISVDGGAESGNLTSVSSSGSTVLESRNYLSNEVVNLVSNLTLGVHTVKIRLNSGLNLPFQGFEILNESSTIKVQPGTGYIGGKKYSTNAQQSLAYNSSFESGTLGTRGGRVLIYQKSDGTIAKAVQPVDAAQANLTSANHQNEEVVRTYTVREFGAGRADDFSLTKNTASSFVFTLDDGTTTLVGSAALVNTAYASGAPEGIILNASGSFWTLTFVGTGLDITYDTGTTTADNLMFFLVDGNSIGTVNFASSKPKTQMKIVSGLPYGTHTVKLLRSSSSSQQINIHGFIAYQPKKPTLPANAIELADYNVMANYTASTGGFSNSPSQGILMKANTREHVYVGTWGSGLVMNTSASLSGFYTGTSTNGDYVEYTFFGTGFEIYAGSASTSQTATVTIDGTLYTGTATVTNGGSWNAGTGTATITSAGQQVQVTGLTLGVHKVRWTVTSAASVVHGFYGIAAITPIHSAKSNLYADLQNTLPVGSQGLSDNRSTTMNKSTGVSTNKVFARAIGVSSPNSTTATSFVPCPDMSVTITLANTARVGMQMTANWRHSATNGYGIFGFYVNGILYGTSAYKQTYVATADEQLCLTDTVLLPAGTHKIDVYWSTASGTVSITSVNRTFVVQEL